MDHKTQQNNNVSSKETEDKWFRQTAVAFAFFVLIGYATFIYFLVGKVGSGNEAWPRLTFLFTGVEAIVFSAVGFVFGREVNRSRAEKAERYAKEADEDRKLAEQKELDALAKAKEETLKGENLAKEILNKAPTDPRRLGLSGVPNFSSQSTFKRNEIFNLATTAKQFYPHLSESQLFEKKGLDFLRQELNSIKPITPNTDSYTREPIENIPKQPLDVGMSRNFKKPSNPKNN